MAEELVEGVEADATVDNAEKSQSKPTAEHTTSPPADPADERVPSDEEGDSQQKHKRLKRKKDEGGDDEGADEEPIKIPKKKSKKKSSKKKDADPDGEFLPSSEAFDQDHLDAGDYYEDERERKMAPAKKPASAGKLYFDEVLKRVKERKKKNVQLTAEECQMYCRQLVEKMIAAAHMDMEAVKNGKPGLAKLRMLNEISEFAKPAWRNWCITEGAAVALASWIASYPDGSLPNLSVRTKVLQIISQLPFQSNDLRDNDLGRNIVALWKNQDECDSNRVIIRAIIQKWVRPILRLASSYADMSQDYGMSDGTSMMGLEGVEKERKLVHSYSQEKPQMLNFAVGQERIDAKLKQMFRAIEARRKLPTQAAKVNMDGYIL